jgi:maltose alpha-D-glucosyltransferase/alpha-amylase
MKIPERTIQSLKQTSQLYQAQVLCLAERARTSAGIWSRAYSRPRWKEAVQRAPVWFTGYPASTLCRHWEGPLQALARPDLWKLLRQIGIRGIHIGPVMSAGGIIITPEGELRDTPSVDGYFDPISVFLDARTFGTESHFRHLVEMAEANESIVISDVVPGHTGTGADFRLAELGCPGGYTGLYIMSSIPQEYWRHLPPVSDPWGSAALNEEQVERLADARLIVGRLQRSLEREGATGWDATAEIEGVDFVTRRWVYLHFFKSGQPTLNWLDWEKPALKTICAHITRLLLDWRTEDAAFGEPTGLGAKMIRLDANSFLGIERLSPPCPDGSNRVQSEAHPLSETVTNELSWHIRRLGGNAFQELNMSLDSIARFSRLGPDLAYDFITRPAFLHAVLTRDTSLLRLMYQLMPKYGLHPGMMIHALQNHDEITYELIHFRDHAEDTFRYRDRDETGASLCKRIFDELSANARGENVQYHSANGVCTTITGFIAAALGIQSIAECAAHMEEIRCIHLLCAAFNALQPGVFAVSGWDLVGALPLNAGQMDIIPPDREVRDPRWANRAAYDLMGDSESSMTGSQVPAGPILYGSLPNQLEDESSFCARLRQMLDVRRESGVAIGDFIGVPDLGNLALFAVATMIADGTRILLAVMNFSDLEQCAELRSDRWYVATRRGLCLDSTVASLLLSSEQQEHFSPIMLEPWGYRFFQLQRPF